MAKGMNHFGAQQQKIHLNRKLQEAIRAYKEANDGTPFEYRHYGLLYPRVRLLYESMGFALTWHKQGKNDDDMYWSFMLPKDVEINPDDLN